MQLSSKALPLLNGTLLNFSKSAFCLCPWQRAQTHVRTRRRPNPHFNSQFTSSTLTLWFKTIFNGGCYWEMEGFTYGLSPRSLIRRHLLQLTASPWTTEASTSERWQFRALTNRKATSSNRAPSQSSLFASTSHHIQPSIATTHFHQALKMSL